MSKAPAYITTSSISNGTAGAETVRIIPKPNLGEAPAVARVNCILYLVHTPLVPGKSAAVVDVEE